jgi:hypothetical protein
MSIEIETAWSPSCRRGGLVILRRHKKPRRRACCVDALVLLSLGSPKCRTTWVAGSRSRRSQLDRSCHSRLTGTGWRARARRHANLPIPRRDGGPSSPALATARGPLQTGAQHNSADDVPHGVRGDPCDPSWCGKAGRRAGMFEHVKRPIRPERDVDDRAEVALEPGRVEPGTMDAEKTEPRRGLSRLEPRVRLGGSAWRSRGLPRRKYQIDSYRAILRFLDTHLKEKKTGTK